MNFIAIHSLLLLWLIPVIILLYIYAYKKRKQALQFLADKTQWGQLTSTINKNIRVYKIIIIILAFSALVVALARPTWGEKQVQEVSQSGRDLIFLLDVSRSMLATDIKPNRLERAKIAIRDVLATRHGDRVALIAFAGDNTILCPLTLDYGFFKLMLDDAGPHSVGKGGTLMGDALRMVMRDVIDKQDSKYKDIILITDGEDHESFPIEAASEVGKRGITLYTIGLGSDTMGARVPVNDERHQRNFVKYGGQEVWSKLNPDTLRQMANATPNGRYLNVGTGAIDLGEVYNELSRTAEKTILGKEKIALAKERFQIFLALALLLLCIEMLISDKSKAKQTEAQ